MKLKVLHKALSALVCAALILMAPGPACYEALAIEIKGSGAENLQPKQLPGGAVPVINGVNTQLNPQTIADPSAATGIKTVEAVTEPGALTPAPVVVPVEPTAGPAAPGATKSAADGLTTEDRGGILPNNDETAKVLSDPKAEKSGFLNWLFDRKKGGKKDSDVSTGGPVIDGKPADLSPSTPHEAAGPAPVPAPAAKPTLPSARNRPYRVVGAILGTMMAFAAIPVWPTAALALPMIGYAALGGMMKLNDPQVHLEETHSALGMGFGTTAAVGLVWLGLLPMTWAVALPAVGAMIGYAWAMRKASEPTASKQRKEPKLSMEDAVKQMETVHGMKREIPEPTVKIEPSAPAAPAAMDTAAVKPEEKKESETTAKPEEKADKAPKTPKSFKSLPADAREKTLDDLLAAKDEAQMRARRIAKSADLVGVSINLDDDRAHWIFTFYSKTRKIMVYDNGKRPVSKPRKAGDKSGPVLWNSRFKNAGSLEDAYTALKKEKHWFKPVRVELKPTWKGAPYYLFTDSRGREVRVPFAAEPAAPAVPAPSETKSATPADQQSGTTPPAAPAEPKTADNKPPETKLPAEPPPVVVKHNPVSEGFFGFRWVKGIERYKPGGSAPAPLKKGSLYGVVISAVLGLAAVSFSPGLAFTLPLLGWALGKKINRDPKGARPEKGTLFGLLIGFGLASAAVGLAGLPFAAALLFPALGAWIGYRVAAARAARGANILGRLRAGASVPEIIDQIVWQFDIPRAEVVALGAKLGFAETAPAALWFGIYDKLQKTNKAKRDHIDNEKHEGSVVGELFAHGLSYVPFLPKKWKESLRKKEGSFRHMSNKTYPAGFPGALLRLVEVQKHLPGAFVRFPYHLFDSFVFGYFRRNMSFELLHSSEDYINADSPGSAIHHLEAAMREQARKGLTVYGTFLGSPLGRAIHHWVVAPLVSPLWSFLKRRGTMAIFSAVTMGILGAIAPGLAIMSFSLTAIPLLGPLMVGLAHGLPVAVSSFPIVGALLAPVVAAATMALLKDMIVGRLLNTLLLSFSMTVTNVIPNSITQERVKMQEADAKLRKAVELIKAGKAAETDALVGELGMDKAVRDGIGDLIKQGKLDDAVAKLAKAAPNGLPPEGRRSAWVARRNVLKSGKFWWTLTKQTMKSFQGMVMVGAEIEGIMTYAGGVDLAISRHFDPKATQEAHGFKVFETIGAAIERPAQWKDDHGITHHNMIPFGGAINWGSSLLYKAQDLAGYNISDHVMWLLRPSLKDVRDAKGNPIGAQQMVNMTTHRPDQNKPVAKDKVKDKEAKPYVYEFDKDLFRKAKDHPEEVKKRIAELIAQTGALESEIKSATDWRDHIQNDLKAARDHLAAAEAKRKDIPPLTEEEKAEYERLLKELSGKRDERYIDSKLAERHDIQNVDRNNLDKLRELKVLKDYYDSALGGPPNKNRAGYLDQLAVQSASLGALKERINAIKDSRTIARHEGLPSPASKELVDQLSSVVGKIEKLRAEAQGEMANRDATRQLLAVENKARNRALDDQRSGKEMFELHKNMSRLATVMDMALALNEINAVEKAIAQMQQLLNQRLAAIKASRQQNQDGLNGANNGASQVDQRNKDAQKTIDSDNAQQQNLMDSEKQASDGVKAFSGFQSDISRLIADINARDKGRSANAAAEYQRRLDLLAAVAQFRTDGKLTPRIDPAAAGGFNMNQFKDFLTEVQGDIRDANKGLAQLPAVPLETAGVLIALIPGAGPAANPNQEIHALLDYRAKFLGDKMATIQGNLNTIKSMMDRSNTAKSTDEYGNQNPQSLPLWLDKATADKTKAQGDAQSKLPQIDRLAGDINSKLGGGLPMLSNLPLDQLQTALKTYAAKVQAIQVPANPTPAQHAASIEILNIAQLLPQAARNVIIWSQNEATITRLNSAISTTLPMAQSRLQELVNMFQSVLDDVTADRRFIDHTSGESNQQLINRKTALLKVTMIPALTDAQDLLQNTLIPFQQSSIDSAKAGGPLSQLFSAQLNLINSTQDLYNKTIPWAIASHGGPYGNKAASISSINAFEKTLNDNLNGYTDSKGNKIKGLLQYKEEIKNRLDPNYNGTEKVYTEEQPFSLPKKVAKYTAEMQQRAASINTNDAQINDILTQIQTLSNGQYNLAAYKLPVGVTPDAAGAAKIQGITDTITALSAQLKTIGNSAGSGPPTLRLGGGNGTVPTGNQPPITIDKQQKIALLALDAVRRLGNSSLQIFNPNDKSASYAMLRLVYSNAVVVAAQKAMGPDGIAKQGDKFVADGVAAINAAISNAETDKNYINSGGTRETPDAVFTREITSYTALDNFLKEGIGFFGILMASDKGAFDTINQINKYYTSLQTVYSGGKDVNAGEIQAYQQMSQALQNTLNSLEVNRAKVTAWISELDDPHFSALRRPMQDISNLMVKARAVLEENIKYHDLTDQVGRSENILKSQLTQVEEQQELLKKILKDNDLQDRLPPDLVARIDKLRLGSGMWEMSGGSGPDQSAAIVVKKNEFGEFVDSVLGIFQVQNPGQNLGSIKDNIMRNPANLAGLIPDSRVMDFGDTADGFYMVYQSNFSVPHGLNTGTWVTLGNVAKVWGNNVSVTGYQFVSPPENAAINGASNAPYGDKGVEVQIESLQGRSWVNYLNIDLHRFAFSIPPDNGVTNQASQSRMMIFDDYAMMLFGDKLYVGLAGLGDFALDNPGGNPYYYGGNFKTSVKLTEVMSLNAEQQALFAKDPRTFLQQVKLDFTGYNPDLNKTFDIRAEGAKKDLFRTQVGPSFNIQRLLDGANQNPNPDAFTMDLFFANTAGTDDINQQTVGASILKGFTLRDDSGKPWMQIQNKTTGELGTKSNTLTDKLSVTLPNQGIVLSGQGQILGTASAYYGEISKKIGDNASLALGYGSPYVGMANRLSLTMNTLFTLGQLWQSVVDRSKEDLKGGETLKKYNTELDDFFKAKPGEKPFKSVEELKKVFDQDVARKLLEQDIGAVTRDIEELRRAGAILDNTRVRAMVGYVTNAISNDPTDLAVGGGFTGGTVTELTLNKTQKQLIEAKAQSLYADGLRLQERMLELAKNWQAAVAQIAQAQWDLKMAGYIVHNAQNAELRKEAEATAAEATGRLHEAVINYNILSGRNPTDPTPFDNLNSADLEALMGEIRNTIEAPDRFKTILHSLDPDELKKLLGEGDYDVMNPNDKVLKDRYHSNPFNVVDWIPFIDRFTVGVGAQISTALSNQVLEFGGSVRLPFYDPTSKAADHAYVLETKATIAQMRQMYEDRRLKTDQEIAQARLWKISADAARPALPTAIHDLSMAIRAYRNHLISPTQLRQAFASWHWYVTTILDADNKSTVADAWAKTDETFSPETPVDPNVIHIDDLNKAIGLVVGRSHSLEEVGLRAQAAQEMTKSNDHRIQKIFLDLHFGVDLTATGVGFVPQLGIGGVPITPILGFEFKPEEMKELQQQEGHGQSEYYEALKIKLQAGLAVQFYQNIAALRSTAQSLQVMDQRILPPLQAAVERAKQGGSGTDAVAAQRALDEALLRRDQARLAFKQAQATVNYLLGRGADSPLVIDISSDQALESLRQTLTQLNPVEAERRIHEGRVETARAVQTMADKGLKKEQLALEPVSIVVRSLGRLFTALGADTTGDPNVRAAAEVQRLTEESARDEYQKNREVEIARKQAEYRRAAAELESIKESGKALTDPESALRGFALEGRMNSLYAGLLALGSSPTSPTGGYSSVPRSFADLKGRLEDRTRQLSAVPAADRLDLMDPATLIHQAEGFARYFYAHTTMGRVPIDKSFVEGWVTVRLRSPDTPPDVLLRLAQLEIKKADGLYKNDLEAAASKADILLADFEANVRMHRWTATGALPGTTPKERDQSRLELERGIQQRLEAQKDQIIAVLGLDPATPLEALEKLVPYDAAGASDLKAQSEGFLKQIEDMQIERIRKVLFDGGLPAEFGNADDLMNQIKANTLAQRMSYKGVTPVAAFGIFRDTKVGGIFLEAPDVRQIQRGLENILTDVLRKDLQSTGRLQELTLQMNLLMSKVEDGARALEKRRELIKAAEADYRAQMGRGDAVEAEAARQRVVKAWFDFSDQMVKTKSDFINLVTELSALSQGSSTGLRPLSDGPTRDMAPLRHDPKAELLDFWADRMLDENFESALGPVIDGLAAKDRPEAAARIAKIKEGLALRAQLYRTAKMTAGLILSKDFTAAERLDLLTRTDVQGKREAVQARLSELLQELGDLDPKNNPGWAKLLEFLRSDIEARQDVSGTANARALAAARGLRDAYWHAVPAPYGVEGAFVRLEDLKNKLGAARQALLDSYLLAADEDPTRFILKDVKLDAYLKAEQNFDDELLKTFARDEVKKDPAMYSGLNGLFDVHGALGREIDAARAGRGLRAIDALIMLEKARLSAARWSHKSPAEVDLIAEALDSLQAKKDQWLSGATDLVPLYALTTVSQDGARLWTIDGWLDVNQVAKAKVTGHIELELDTPQGKKKVVADVAQREGRWYIDYEESAAGQTAKKTLEIIGGIDAAESEKIAAEKAVKENQAYVGLYERMKSNDFALDMPTLGRDGFTVDEVFGPGGLHSQGRVFFFKAPGPGDPPGRLHDALHPLAALRMAPDKYVMKVYTGTEALSRDRFPTLESLSAAPQTKDFHELSLSPKGAAAMIEIVQKQKSFELRQGWVDVKLNSYAFARADQADVDYENARAAIRLAEADKLSRQPGQLGVVAFAAELDRLVAQSPELAAAAARRDASRGKSYAVTDLFQSRDDFKSVEKAFHNAQKDLDQARKELMAADAEEKEVQKKADAKQKETNQASLAYQKVLRDVRVAEANALALKMNANTSAFKAELEKRVAQNKDYLEAQKTFDPIAKEYTKAVVKLKDAHVKTANAQKAVDEAVLILEHSQRWSLYQSDDVTLSLDDQGGVVGASGRAAYGSLPFNEKIGEGATARVLKGPLFGGVMNDKAQLKESYTSQEQIDAAFKRWTIKSVTMQGEDDKVGSGKKVKTVFRMSHYEATVPETKILNGKAEVVPTAEPVLLNRRYMQERIDGADSKMTRAKYYGVMPWNWGSLLLEIPRGVIGAPVEILTGRDAQQQHYLGRVYMYKLEGGDTQHHGFFRTVAGVFDILNLLPDPVGRYYDPSQFPETVKIDSPLKPGESIISKDMRYQDKAKDVDVNVHYGVQGIQRVLTQATEDLAAAKSKTLAHFHGGTQELLIAAYRGRGRDPKYGEDKQRGIYEESRRTGAVGNDAINQTLKDPSIYDAPGSDGSGPVVLSAKPGNLAVDKVEKRVTVIPGADQYQAEIEALTGTGVSVQSWEKGVRETAPALKKDFADKLDAYAGALEDRPKVDKETEKIWNRVHELAWRWGAEQALNRDIEKTTKLIESLKEQLGFWNGYLDQLAEALKNRPKPPTPNPGDPNEPIPPLPDPNVPNGMFWALFLCAATITTLLLWIIWRGSRLAGLLRGQKPVPPPAAPASPAAPVAPPATAPATPPATPAVPPVNPTP